MTTGGQRQVNAGRIKTNKQQGVTQTWPAEKNELHVGWNDLNASSYFLGWQKVNINPPRTINLARQSTGYV